MGEDSPSSGIFGKFQKEAHPKRAFLKELENHIPIQLANRMKPMVLEEGIHPEEIQILVIDESDSEAIRTGPVLDGSVIFSVFRRHLAAGLAIHSLEHICNEQRSSLYYLE